MKRQLKYLLMVCGVLVVFYCGFKIIKVNQNVLTYREVITPQGQTAEISKGNPFTIKSAFITKTKVPHISQQEQAMLADNSPKQVFLVTQVASSYQGSPAHVILNIDSQNTYETVLPGTQRVAGGWQYVFQIPEQAQSKQVDYQISVDNPNLPKQTRQIFKVTPKEVQH